MKKILLLVASIFAVFGVLAFGATVKAQYIAYPIKCADPVQSLSWPSCLLADEKYDYATGKRTATIACENPISGGNCNAPVIAAQLATLNASRKQAIISALQSTDDGQSAELHHQRVYLLQ